MNDTATLLWSTLFGAIAMGFLSYAKKQKASIPFVVGVGLLVVPYFVPNLYLMVSLCLALIALPYFLRT
jgi:hypothetical protein